MLTVDLPGGEAPLSIATVRSYFSAVKIFLEWVQPRTHALSALTRDDLADYQRRLARLRISDATRGTRRNAVRLVWVYRDKLDRLGRHSRVNPLHTNTFIPNPA